MNNTYRRISRAGACVLATVMSLAAVSSARADVNAVTLRLAANGIPDPGFNNSGYYIGDAAGHDVFNDVVVDAVGRIVVCGHFSQANGQWQMFVGRFNGDGTADWGFGFFGMASITWPQQTTARSCTIDGSGRIVVAVEEGVVGATTTPSALVVRLNVNGTPDVGFDTDGIAKVSLSGAAHAWPVGVKVASDGKIVLAGDLINTAGGPNHSFIARLGSTGALDNGFASGGLLRSPHGFNDLTVRGLVLDADRPILTGRANNQIWVARFTTLGQHDASFGSSMGMFSTKLRGATELSSEGMSVIVEPGGKIAVAVSAWEQNTQQGWTAARVGMIRLNNNGTLDTTFGEVARDGKHTIIVGYNAYAFDIARMSTGMYVMTGYGWNSSGSESLEVRGITGAGETPFRFDHVGSRGFGNYGDASQAFAGVKLRGYGVAIDVSDRVVVVGSME